MNETRGNARTKPMRGGLKGGEINSLKDSEKTNDIYCLNCVYRKHIPSGILCLKGKQIAYLTPIMTCFITKCENYLPIEENK